MPDDIRDGSGSSRSLVQGYYATGFTDTEVLAAEQEALLELVEFTRRKLAIKSALSTASHAVDSFLALMLEHMTCESCEATGTVCSECVQCSDCCNDHFKCASCKKTKYIDYRCERCSECENCCKCLSCSDCGDPVEYDNYCDTCERCKRDCCDCWTCYACDRRMLESRHQCGDCDYCESCCSCYFCNRCESSVRSTCGDCDYCGDCCTCTECPIEYMHRDLLFHTAAKLEFKRNKLQRYLSTEIEVDKFEEGCDTADLQAAIDKWKDSVVEDRSIDPGFEICTQPTNGDRFLDHLKDLCAGLDIMDAGCSKACGLHVHVGAKDLSFYDLRKVIDLYDKIEPAVFELVSPRRLDGDYSSVCAHTYAGGPKDPREFRKHIFSRLYKCSEDDERGTIEFAKLAKNGDKQVRQQKNEKYSPARYRALNIHSYFLRGTIEFRHHEGTTDYETITNWALTCGNIIDFAARSSHSFISALKGEPRDILLLTLPDSLKDWAKSKMERYSSRDGYSADEVHRKWDKANKQREKILCAA